MAELKPCRLCNFSRQKSYGLVVPSLDQLKAKGCEFFGLPNVTVSVVLEEDGTIVEDESYFLCLPSNTKFMLLQDKETWAPINRIDGGTIWMARESMNLDAVDSSCSDPGPWWILAQQLRHDLASIILMSEADLQALVDVPVLELAAALGFPEKKVENLQETLQRVLDHREEERQAKELLQLYLKAVENEDRLQAESSQQGAGDMDVTDSVDDVDSSYGFTIRTLMVLKGKTSPETRLSTEELQMVVSTGAVAMEQVLGWDSERTSRLVQACEEELTVRLGRVQAMRSLSSSSTQSDDSSNRAEDREDTPAKRSK